MLAEVGRPFILSLGVAGYPGVLRTLQGRVSRTICSGLIVGLVGSLPALAQGVSPSCRPLAEAWERFEKISRVRIVSFESNADAPLAIKLTIQWEAPDRYRAWVPGGMEVIHLGNMRYERASATHQWKRGVAPPPERVGMSPFEHVAECVTVEDTQERQFRYEWLGQAWVETLSPEGLPVRIFSKTASGMKSALTFDYEPGEAIAEPRLDK